MRIGFVCACALALALFIQRAEAHHPGHGSGGALGLFNPFSTISRPPRSFVNLTFTFDSLDGDLGEVYTTQLAGEYAIHRRFSLGARLPILVVRQDFVSSEGLGDVALTLKGLLWEWKESRTFLSMGLDTSFPTGRESEGLGEGDVVFTPYFTISKAFQVLDFFGTIGSTIVAGDDPRPSFDFAMGVNAPVLKGDVGLDLSLAFQGSTTITSEVLTAGSTKAYLRPGLTIRPIDPLALSLGGKVSVLDTMEVRPGEVLAPTSSILMTDVVYGFLFDINYSF